MGRDFILQEKPEIVLHYDTNRFVELYTAFKVKVDEAVEEILQCPRPEVCMGLADCGPKGAAFKEGLLLGKNIRSYDGWARCRINQALFNFITDPIGRTCASRDDAAQGLSL